MRATDDVIINNLSDNGPQLGLHRSIHHIRVIFPLPKQGALCLIAEAIIIGIFIAKGVFFCGFSQVGLITHRSIFQVCRNRQHFQAVNFIEFLRLSQGCSGHASQFFIHAEVILNCDGGIGHVFSLDLDALLGLHSLMQSIGPAPSGH